MKRQQKTMEIIKVKMYLNLETFVCLFSTDTDIFFAKNLFQKTEYFFVSQTFVRLVFFFAQYSQ